MFTLTLVALGQGMRALRQAALRSYVVETHPRPDQGRGEYAVRDVSADEHAHAAHRMHEAEQVPVKHAAQALQQWGVAGTATASASPDTVRSCARAASHRVQGREHHAPCTCDTHG